MIGRPLILSRDIIAEIPKLIKRFCYLSDVADYLGCAKWTLVRWHKLGRELRDKIERAAQTDDSPAIELNEREQLYLAFCAALRKARAELRADRLLQVRAGDKGWQSAAWELERVHPKMYGRHRGLDAEEQYMRRAIKKKAREQIADELQAPARETE